MHKPRFFITDVFTSRKYGGNPLATFIDCESPSSQEMQQIAREINFSETTYITSRQSKDGVYDVRIFTPNAELFGVSNIDMTVGQGYEIGRPSDLVLRTSNTKGEIEVFVDGSVAEVAEDIWG
jgi:predicted PhzF superfamily epimerase YddE/YHI9